MNHTLLIVDDEKNTREGLRWALERKNFKLLLAGDGEEAFEILRSNNIDILLTDMRMPKMDGMELLEKTKIHSPSTEVVMLTGHGTVESAVDAMKAGAYDYLIKPINIDELNLLIDRIITTRALQDENIQLREKIDEKFGIENIVGKSEAMNQVFTKVKTVAPSRAGVLIYGESGTGKEMIANAIHLNSPRKNKPFIKINCGALPLTLLESELFGHEKGAFTGAIKTKPGRFEMADGGTILLDEIGETSPEFQVRLLRVLQEGTFERVGGTATYQVDVRVLAATNKKLEDLVQKGEFREDLYYRLNVVSIELPPLRERRDDIPLLINHFMDEFSVYYNKPKLKISHKVMSMLQSYHWPGNVRQLRNVIEGAVVMGSNEIEPTDLPEEIRLAEGGVPMVSIPAGTPLRDAEKELIQAALIHFGGNRAKTARALGLGRKTLYRKMEEFELE